MTKCSLNKQLKIQIGFYKVNFEWSFLKFWHKVYTCTTLLGILFLFRLSTQIKSYVAKKFGAKWVALDSICKTQGKIPRLPLKFDRVGNKNHIGCNCKSKFSARITLGVKVCWPCHEGSKENSSF